MANSNLRFDVESLTTKKINEKQLEQLKKDHESLYVPVEQLIANEGFTPENLLVAIQQLSGIQSKYPKLFFHEFDLPSCIEFVGVKIIPLNENFKEGTQSHRHGSQNPKKSAIGEDIAANGYKLFEVLGGVIEVEKVSKNGEILTEYEYLTANGRTGALCDYGETVEDAEGNSTFERYIKNNLVYVYKKVGNPSRIELRDAIDIMGARFNSINSPSTKTTKNDITRTLTSIGVRNSWGWVDGGETFENNYDEKLQEYFDRSTDGSFSDTAKLKIFSEVRMNLYEKWDKANNSSESFSNSQVNKEESLIIAWDCTKNAKYTSKKYMELFGYNVVVKGRNNQVLEVSICSSYNSALKCMRAAWNMTEMYPNANIKVVIHTSTLDGKDTDYINQYESNVVSFVEDFEKYKSRISEMCGVDKSILDYIKVEAALPAVGSHHNIDLPVNIEYNENKGEIILSQRTGSKKYYKKLSYNPNGKKNKKK